MNEIKLLIEMLKEFGFPVAISAVLFYALWWMMREHRNERAEWRKDSREDKAMITQALNELTLEIKLRK